MTTDVKIKENVKINIDEPKRWKVIVLNDDHTPMDFVIAMLVDIYRHDETSAYDITMQVHETGSGVAGEYDFEIAEIKVIDSTKMARENGFPLQIKMEITE